MINLNNFTDLKVANRMAGMDYQVEPFHVYCQLDITFFFNNYFLTAFLPWLSKFQHDYRGVYKLFTVDMTNKEKVTKHYFQIQSLVTEWMQIIANQLGGAGTFRTDGDFKTAFGETPAIQWIQLVQNDPSTFCTWRS